MGKRPRAGDRVVVLREIKRMTEENAKSRLFRPRIVYAVQGEEGVLIEYFRPDPKRTALNVKVRMDAGGIKTFRATSIGRA